jgi:hypothetical protein
MIVGQNLKLKMEELKKRLLPSRSPVLIRR